MIARAGRRRPRGASGRSSLYLPYISLYLAYISLYLAYISLYLPYISLHLA